MGGPISAELAAFGAFVDDDVALSGIGFHADGHHLTAAIRGAIPGIDVKVERPQTERAVIAGTVTEGEYLSSAVGADEGSVVFCESFLFPSNVLLKSKIEEWVIGSIREIGGAQKQKERRAHGDGSASERGRMSGHKLPEQPTGKRCGSHEHDGKGDEVAC